MHSSHFGPTPAQFVGSFRIPHVDRDASGLALHRDTGHLWVVIDKPERLVEFTDEGEFVSTVELTGFEDTEGLCHLGGDRFAIAEERKMRITLVEIPRGTTECRSNRSGTCSRKNHGTKERIGNRATVMRP